MTQYLWQVEKRRLESTIDLLHKELSTARSQLGVYEDKNKALQQENQQLIEHLLKIKGEQVPSQLAVVRPPATKTMTCARSYAKTHYIRMHGKFATGG